MYIVKCSNGSRWKVIEARSLADAIDSIAAATVSGSVGHKSIVDKTYIGGDIETTAHVRRLNSDNTERQPYQKGY